MLCKMKMVDEARGLYEEMKSLQQQELLPSVSTYNILCREGRLGDAKDLFQEMIESGRIPDVNSYEILVEALCKAGKIFQGHELFKQLIVSPGSFHINRSSESGFQCQCQAGWPSHPTTARASKRPALAPQHRRFASKCQHQ
ncbi:pentatricopeptide repeat-containing protein At3g22470, mitochondrial-like [Selaginella moellendorffii]|uniref:pentatricopeptide repeat-containing protein At3g22470, mitochondrial-like n=1 Tax=Selaginella moellendorffii TaxID=88036 RepID=UPI000D1CA645|nr:pentatricopeptide repeat-containing protein At3g22470, mitochondrial-like [Selaginella moellendorffii]|eukprot:XP_024516931.1 pentatricopeptide repeat-containing protein At3g22470, mitochondrial-like [Selaginella moellendorffii]